MITKALFLQWGSPLAGRERMAIEEFGSYMNWANGLKSRQAIERFEVYAPTTGTQQRFTGFTVLEGTDDQIDAIVKSEDFRLRVSRVMTVCNNFTVEACDAGGKVGQRMQLYGKALQQIGL